MTVESKLEEAFNTYLNPAKAELCSPRMKTPTQRPVQVLETRSMELRRLVDQIEQSPEFSGLVNATANAFPHESNVSHYVADKKTPPHEGKWRFLDLRSTLVHGKEELLDRKTMNTHLREARTLARRSLI